MSETLEPLSYDHLYHNVPAAELEQLHQLNGFEIDDVETDIHLAQERIRYLKAHQAAISRRLEQSHE